MRLSRKPALASLHGRVAAVTGGGRGIGRATAIALADAGARVAVGDLDLDAAREVAAEIGSQAIGLPLDVTDAAALDTFVVAVQEQLGPIDIMVNNAGIMPVDRLVDESHATARKQVDINVHGVLHGCKAVLPGMLARRRGHIINVASSGGRIPVPGSVTYGGTKAFVAHATDALRLELHGTGVTASAILPGIVKTDLTSGLHTPRGASEQSPEAIAAAILATIGRPRPEVWVPASLGRQSRLLALIPRVIREPLVRVVGADSYLLQRDESARAAYQERADREVKGTRDTEQV
ncbi:SDR family oxidoreductase [Paraconexibacter sp.]|uniref:SDR family oxidoreductase n=1 Tax=Paraconexibacter sp. TaxID=2949640 RepID=UPI0035615921